MKIHWLIYFWHILVGTNLAMFFLSATLGRKDLMLLNAVSMFSCLFMAHITKNRYSSIKSSDQNDE